MSEMKPYRVEVSIDAPHDVVWRALTVAEEIQRWFGWDYAALADEIQLIFFTHMTPKPPHTIEMHGGMGVIEVVPDGTRTIVRVVTPGDLADAKWSDVYDEMEEGWRAFFHQLKHLLERHPGATRRTVFLAGDAVTREVVAGIDAESPGKVWSESRHQRAVAVDAFNGGLITVMSPKPLSVEEPSRVNVIITTYDLSEAEYAAVRERWETWWRALAGEPTVLP